MLLRAALVVAVVCAACAGQAVSTHTTSTNGALPADARRVERWHAGGQTLVAWRYRGRHVQSTMNDARYALTTAGTPRAVLVQDSPFPIAGKAVRFADVTGDGRADVLLTLLCNPGCNHNSATASVFADTGSGLHRIYGWGFLDGSKNGHVGVHGRVIIETTWGARDGLLWFDEPRGGRSVCCPAYRLRTFLHWDGKRFRVVRRQRTAIHYDP